MKRLFRWIVLLPLLGILVMMLLCVPVVILAYMGAHSGKSPGLLVTISKETTYITEPLRADGYPDYVAALNQRFSQGVTPENNAAVLFWKAVGPGEIDAKVREEYFKMLGIPPLPEKGDYLVNLDKYVEQRKASGKPVTLPPAEKEGDTIWDTLDTAMKRPWSKQQFPVLADWLAANEKPLSLLVEASKRPRRYNPLVSSDKTMLFAVLLPAIQQYRDVARALAARAMLRVHEGKTDNAWEDLLACHRLARLVGQGPMLVEALVAITIDGIACGKDQALLQHAKLSAAQITGILDELNKLPLLPIMADKIDVAERFTYLDFVSVVAREGPDALSKELGCGWHNETVALLMGSIGRAMTDWDVATRMGNSWYDRIIAAYRQSMPTERKKALDSIDDDIRKLTKSTTDLKSLGLSILCNPSKAVSERVGQVFVCLLMPALSACANAENRGNMQFELNKLAFALAAYQADHGSYPAKLADLTPKYVKEVPKDIFNDAELHYRQEGDGFVLYSVGMNGKDDGGKGYEDFIASDEPGEWDDLVVRIPAAATPTSPKKGS